VSPSAKRGVAQAQRKRNHSQQLPSPPFPGPKDGPELLSSVNPTFTWVRLAQRVPVRIHLTYVPSGVLIRAGMTCTVVMKEGAAPEIGLGIKKVMTAIFGVPSSWCEIRRCRAQTPVSSRHRSEQTWHGCRAQAALVFAQQQ
jgi:hypothetical protein